MAKKWTQKKVDAFLSKIEIELAIQCTDMVLNEVILDRIAGVMQEALDKTLLKESKPIKEDVPKPRGIQRFQPAVQLTKDLVEKGVYVLRKRDSEDMDRRKNKSPQ